VTAPLIFSAKTFSTPAAASAACCASAQAFASFVQLLLQFTVTENALHNSGHLFLRNKFVSPLFQQRNTEVNSLATIDRQ
jgi:hypothetical protein